MSVDTTLKGGIDEVFTFMSDLCRDRSPPTPIWTVPKRIHLTEQRKKVKVFLVVYTKVNVEEKSTPYFSNGRIERSSRLYFIVTLLGILFYILDRNGISK